MEYFYREQRKRHSVLMDPSEPEAPLGGQWNFDHDNREPPPKGATTLGVTEPWWPTEDDIDAEVARLRAAGVPFRNDVTSGPGGSQVLVQDPSENVVEIFQPAER